MEILKDLVIYIITIYLIGDRIKTNSHIKVLLTEVESGFSSLVLSLKEAKISNSLKFLSKVYGFLVVIGFIGLFLNAQFEFSVSVTSIILTTFTFSTIMFGSLNWVIRHKSLLKTNKLVLFIFLSWPFFLAWMELSEGFPVFTEAYDMLVRFPLFWGDVYINDLSIWWKASALTVLSAVIMAFYYLLAWVLALLLTLISIFVALTPVYLARFIHWAWPQDHFFFFTMLVLGVLAVFS